MDELTRDFLIESHEGLDRMERGITELEQRPQDRELLAEIFRAVHTIKGTTGFLGFSRLEKLAHAGENLLSQLRDGKLVPNRAITTALLQLMDALRAILRCIEIENNEGVGEGEDARLITLIAELQSPAKGDANAAGDSVATDARPAFHDNTVRVDIALLDRMMDLVGELLLTRNQILLATESDSSLMISSRRLDILTADLHESVISARMQPVSSLFSRFPRIVRDLSQSLNRKVRLIIEGQETELDRCMLDAIKEPLTHTVRNSLDHGIEPPELRFALGKEKEGILTLCARHESNHIVIEVADDGAGICVEKVRIKAIERGLINAEQAPQLSEDELLQLVFHPGFSTAEKVTNISGRGVGMDVVRTNIDKVGGKVQIESRPGKGTTLRFRLPLTLAVIPALIVRTVQQSFAIPQASLLELVHISRQHVVSAVEWIDDIPLYRFRGKLLPLIFLDRMLSLYREPYSHSSYDCFVVVLNAGERHLGLVVDEIAGLHEIVVKPLSPVLSSIGLYSGVTILGNGTLALILDSSAIAARARIRRNAGTESMEHMTGASETVDQIMDFLLVDIAGRKTAIPLSNVVRIEQIRLLSIEYLGPQAVLNFDGKLLPIEDAGGLIAPEVGDQNIFRTVVVCAQADSYVGFMVSRVLKIAPGCDLFQPGSDQRAVGATLIDGRVVSVVDMGRIPPFASAPESRDETNMDHSFAWPQVSRSMA